VDDICLKAGAAAVVDAGGGDAAVTPDGSTPPPDMTRLGQACASSTDCGDNLTCVPSAAGGIQGGLCDLTSFGITPTGKTCGGECTQASDCCELPYNASNYYYTGTAFTDAGRLVAPRTCNDLLQYFIGGDATICNSTLNATPTAAACNLFQTYCNGCVTNTWACNANQCQYTGPCSTAATSDEDVGLCPIMTRTGRQLGLKCTSPDGGTTGSCQNSACATNADCVNQPADNNSTCGATDCVCLASTCYFQCASNLDCPNGYACDTTTKVCKKTGCSSDTVCKTQLGNVKASCDATSGSCVVPCANDHDCSPSSGAVSALGVFRGQVCGPNHFCVTVAGGCSSDTDCLASGTSQVNTFCVPLTTPATYTSAITN
jgi:hypothetical protein